MGDAGADDVAISVVDLRVAYGDREILHGITFDVKRGETMVILGGSGSGKSTLLRTLVGLERPTSGEVWIQGVNTAKISEREMDAIRKKMGMSFQGSALFGSLTVGENVALPFSFRQSSLHSQSLAARLPSASYSTTIRMLPHTTQSAILVRVAPTSRRMA